MKSGPRLKIILITIIVAVASFESAYAADLNRGATYLKKHRRVAALTFTSYSPECRTGWWQTLHNGYARPLWATRCR